MKDSKSVLVIDDDDGIQILVNELLLRRGFTVERAADGGEALQKLRGGKYELLLLDIMMPKINGFEVLQELRSMRPEMLKRTVVFTAASDVTLGHFDRSQVFRVVRKPFDIKVLLSALGDCLSAHDGAGGVPDSSSTRSGSSPKAPRARTGRRE